MLLLEVPDRVNQEILSFARELVPLAEPPAVPVATAPRRRSALQRLFDRAMALATRRAVAPQPATKRKRGPKARRDVSPTK